MTQKQREERLAKEIAGLDTKIKMLFKSAEEIYQPKGAQSKHFYRYQALANQYQDEKSKLKSKLNLIKIRTTP